MPHTSFWSLLQTSTMLQFNSNAAVLNLFYLPKPSRHWVYLPDTVHVVVAVKWALSKLIWLHGEVRDHQGVQGSLQLSQWLLWEGCQEGQHQQGLTLKRSENPAKLTYISALSTLLSNSTTKSKNRTVIPSNSLQTVSITLRFRGRVMSTSSRVKVQNTGLNASWLILEQTEESIWWGREK